MRYRPKTLLRVVVAAMLALATLLIVAPSPAAANGHHTFPLRARCKTEGPFLFESDDRARARAEIDCVNTRAAGVWLGLWENGRLVRIDTDVNRNEAEAFTSIGCGRRARVYQAVAVFVAEDFFGRVGHDIVFSPWKILC